MAPCSTSTKPIDASLALRSTRAGHGTSQPAVATACSSTTANRTHKPVSAQSVTSHVRTRRAASVASMQSAAATNPIQKPLATQSVAVPARSGYGDAHAREEFIGMLVYATAIRKAGVVDEEMLNRLCRPWQEKGVLEMEWKEDYLLAGVREVEEGMDLKQAEAIARKKDAAEKKYLEEYFGGGGKNTVQKKRNDLLKSAVSGKVSKKSSTSSRKPSSTLPVISEERSASVPTQPSKPTNVAPRSPLPGCPDYAVYNYYQLASICFERNLVSGRNAQTLRSRLIQDDVNVIQDLPREAKSYSKEKVRERKYKAPIVPNAPQASPAVYSKTGTKRARGAEGDENLACGKKVRTY